MAGKTLLLSVRPKHARRILEGTKTIELRRICPRVGRGDLVLVYATSPVRAVVGSFRIDSVICESPEDLWARTGSDAGVTQEQFAEYFDGASLAVGIVISDPHPFSLPITLPYLRTFWPGFHPPRSYRYLGHSVREWLLACDSAQEAHIDHPRMAEIGS